MDRGAWWAAVYGVAQSRTQLKQLSMHACMHWRWKWQPTPVQSKAGIVNKAKIDVFLELSCFFSDPADVGNLISGSSAFSKTSLNIRKFTVHVLLKPGLENFEHSFISV